MRCSNLLFMGTLWLSCSVLADTQIKTLELEFMSDKASFLLVDTSASVSNSVKQEAYADEDTYISTDKPPLIEEVIVVGTRYRKHYNLKNDKRVELIHDLDKERTGIVIYLGQKSHFRLFINYFDYTNLEWEQYDINQYKP